jgi:hypothetical protein
LLDGAKEQLEWDQNFAQEGGNYSFFIAEKYQQEQTLMQD